MKTCKDCIHFDACANFWYSEFDSTASIEETKKKRATQEICKTFKDKDLSFTFPCKIGETVYGVLTNKDWGYDGEDVNVYEGKVYEFVVVRRNGKQEWFAYIMFGLLVQIWSVDFSEKVFFSKKDADEKLRQIKMQEENQ